MSTRNWFTVVEHNENVWSEREVYGDQTMGEACIMFDAFDSSYDPKGFTVKTYEVDSMGVCTLRLKKEVRA